MNDAVCLELNNLSIDIVTRQGLITPVNNISFKIPAGKITGLVGESGSGKSLLAKAILRLGSNNIKYRGEIIFNGCNLLTVSSKKLRNLRGRRISMVFQDASAALNPVLPIGWQIKEVFTAHGVCKAKDAQARSIELLDIVGFNNPEKVYRQFPYQLSGGMKQRVMIAMAIALKPDLIIADEPTTALDMTVQAQILSELRNLQQQFGISILMISHDMGVIAEMADNVVVIQKGRLVEQGECFTIFDRPRHEYTKALIAASRLEFINKRDGINHVTT